MNPQVDAYLLDGCGRCAYYATPMCKVKNWTQELALLRKIVLECGLTEELKWKVPVYTDQAKNILIVSAFKEYCSLGFFKGALMADKDNLLVKQGESVQSSRIIKFTDPDSIVKLTPVLKQYISEAVAIERKGEKVVFIKNLEPMPEELKQKFDEFPALKDAFYALTPGKQRGYIIHISQPKQSSSRVSRIEKCMDKILRGEGFHDKYKC
jgi:uncharacterized protein YdeI (YjbR/CyaY-like superfamily)